MNLSKVVLITFIPILLLGLFASAQTRKVTGVIKNADSIPLIGVSVQVKGTGTGTSTDENGRFSIDVTSTGQVLIVSYIGMETQEVITSGSAPLQITLKSSGKTLDDVVVVGYGTQKKENLTGSVAIVKGKSLENRPTASPANLLQGLAAGLTVSASGQGGYPGATSTIKVRNYSSWKGGANDPLYVIDGFTRDKAAFDNLNPNDIENISILKDASSASIYGMKAGNGVILITTKKGSQSRTQISYNANYTVKSATRLPKLMNAFEDASFLNSIYEAQGYASSSPVYFAPDELEHFKTHSYSPYEEAWTQPWSNNHNLSLSGGSEKVRYFVSGNYLHQAGGLNQKYDKFSLLAKLDGEITRGLTFSLNLNGAHTNNNRPNFPYGTDQNMSYFWYYMYYALPYKPVYINGLPVAGGTGDASSGISFVDERYMHNNYRNDQNNTLNGIFELKYEIPGVKGLKALGRVGYNKGFGYNKYFNAANLVYFFKQAGTNGHITTNELDSSNAGGFTGLNNLVAGAYGAPQYMQSGYSQTRSYQLDLMLTYDNTFGDHSINSFVAFEPQEVNGHYLNTSAKFFNNPSFQEINGGSEDPINRGANGMSNNYGQSSFFGRIDYNYAQKYLLGVTFRADGSNKFAPDRRWGYFPAVSAGWNMASENFFEGLTKHINVLKLRTSYGITGTDNITAWQWQQVYNYNASSGMLLGSSLPAGISLGTFANPAITWEKNYNYDIGIDASMPDNLASLTIDWWHKKTTDILDTRIASTPVTVGAQLPAVNYGEAVANGFEISLGHEKSIGDFHYRVGANWSLSNNKYLVKDQAATTRDFQNQIGKPIDGWISGYESEGIIRTQRDADAIIQQHGPNFTILGFKPVPGMIMYKDIRGPAGTNGPDGIIDANDQTPLSFNGVPRVVYGFNGSVSWKGLELSVIFSGFSRYDVMLPGGFTGVRAVGIYQNNLTMWNDSWTPLNTDAPLPSAAYTNRGVLAPSTFWMRSGAYLRMKNLTVNYSLPYKYLKNILLKGANVYFSGENLLLWDKVGIYDPELGNALAYPMMKSFSFGLNVQL